MVEVVRKTCRRCKAEKPAEEFYVRKSSSDGLHPWCKACAYESSKASKEKKRDHHLAVQREATRRWREQNPLDYRVRRLAKYGLTIETYDALLASQDGVCALCRGESGDTNLHVDHDHESGKVRGILCGKCNRALGYLDDSPERLLAAVAYLGSHV